MQSTNWSYQWQVFLLALSIFTRLPVPVNIPYSEERKNEAYKFAGLVGLVVGAIGAMVFILASQLWPPTIAVVLSMASTIYVTGAFHEDGFADTCDGFGGGFTPERKLAIMKDSRVGAYGLIGMVLILLLKFVTLVEIEQLGLALIVAHSLSRTMAVSFIYTHDYVRADSDSKLHISANVTAEQERTWLVYIGLVALLLLANLALILLLTTVLLLLRWLFSTWLIRQIGGYSGDALGAIQQISEVICYLVFAAWWL